MRACTEDTSSLAKFYHISKDPLEMFCDLLKRVDSDVILFNLATIDKKFAILNRTMNFKGIVDGAITYTTERKAKNYKNVKRKNKVSATFLFPNVENEVWQVRLFDAIAVELTDEQIAKRWEEERLYMKIRSHISKCGKEINPDEHKKKHDALLEQVESSCCKLEQTRHFTVFKIIPKRWDFYKSKPRNQIGARIQYRRDGECWEVLHISA